MASKSRRDRTILVVDDEEDVADVYAMHLRTAFSSVRTANGGPEALSKMDHSVDVVLLDRRMPTPGGEVLAEIKNRGYDCRVVFLTAVDPNFDVAGMPVDDYLRKPVTGEELIRTVEHQLDAKDSDDPIMEFFSITSKLSVLRAEKTEQELAESEEFQRLERRVEELKETLDAEGDELEAMVERYGR